MKIRTKTFRRLAALLLALVMVSALAAAAFADPIIDTTQTANLYIHKYISEDANDATGEETTDVPGDATGNVQFSIVKVSDIITYSKVTGDPEVNEVQLVFQLNDAVKELLGAEPDVADVYYSSGNLQSALDTVLANKNQSSIENFVKNNTSASKEVTSAAQDTLGTAAFEGLSLGLYLVAETTVPYNIKSATAPFLICLPMTDISGEDAQTTWNYTVHVYPKNQEDASSLEKLTRVDDYEFAEYQTVSVGDTVTFRLISELPTIATATTYLTKFSFEDTLPAGLTYVANSATISFYADKAAAFSKSGTTKSGTNVWSNPVSTGDLMFGATLSDQTLTFALTANGLAQLNSEDADNAYKNTFMVVEYQATVNEDAVLGDNGNINKAIVTYARTNESVTMSYEDQAVLYTYGIDLTKELQDGNGKDVTKVQFTLKNGDDTVYVTGSAGEYYAATAETTGAVTVVSPAADGSLKIYGLEADTYKLTETKTESGYTLLKEPITIVIAGTVPKAIGGADSMNAVGEVEVVVDQSASAKVDGNDVSMRATDGSENALVPLKVVNNKGYNLPQTGGTGLWMITIIGVLGFAAGFAMLKKGKKAN